MTAVTLLLSGAPAQAQTDMHVASRDPNTRFLCTYGSFLVSASSSLETGSGFSSSGWTHVAVPIIGHGQTVSRIRVVEARVLYDYGVPFSAGIYGDRAGFPGKPIAVGTGRIGQACGAVTISIVPMTLNRNGRYWIEETVPQIFGDYSALYWYADPKTKRRAYVQRHKRGYGFGCKCRYSITTPWTEQSAGPYLKLK